MLRVAQSVVDGILADAVSSLSLKAAMTAYTKELMARATEAAKPVSHETTKGHYPKEGPPLVTLVTPRPAISYLPHQESGIRWMLDREAPDAAFCRGGILGDDMGLGKTFQTIGLIKNSPPCKTLILCPPALLAGWTEELKACDLPVTGLSHLRETGTVVATYNIAHLHASDFRAAKFDRVILDEGHIIRNGKATKRWWTCMAIARKSPFRWILSATPVQNGAKDWINLCTWLKTKARPSQMTDLASVIMLRRTMEDIRADPIMAKSVPPEPTFIRHGLSIPEGTEEGKLFRTLTDSLDTLMDTRHVSALLVLELYMRIQQFLVHPQLYIESMRAKYKGAYHKPDWTGTATKFDAFTQVLQESQEPTIVFCNFRAEMDRVRDLATSLGWKVWSIRGGMGSEAIGQAVQEAKNHSKTQAQAQAQVSKTHNQNPNRVLIIVQIVAGGAGLNLQFCSRILFLSQHWNPAVVHQACGRAVRIGQTSSVQIHFFSIDDPVALNLDARMAHLHSSKIADAKDICPSLFQGFPQTA